MYTHKEFITIVVVFNKVVVFNMIVDSGYYGAAHVLVLLRYEVSTA